MLVFKRVVYQRGLLPLTHCSHHGGEVGLPFLFVLILGVPDQICVDRLAFIVAFQSVQLHSEETQTWSAGFYVVKAE